jgi:hypothetical protein
LNDFTYISEDQKKSSIRYYHIWAEVVNEEAHLKQEGAQIKYKEKAANAFCNFMITKVNK